MLNPEIEQKAAAFTASIFKVKHFGGVFASFGCKPLVFTLCLVYIFPKLPDLMHSETLQTEPVVTFLCQNFGLLLGICIMLVIALYEEDLMAVTW